MPPRIQPDRKPKSRDTSPANKTNVSKQRKKSDEELISKLNNTEDLTELSAGDQATNVLQLLRFIANTQAELVKAIDTTKSDIIDLQEQNKALSSRISVLEEENIRIDQYSRKGVMTVTGFDFSTTAPQDALEQEVVDMLNKLVVSSPPLTCQDFVAIHRNSKEGRNGRPPTITVKFLRYSDKNKYFTKTAIAKRKTLFRGVGLHHNMCYGLIQEQKLINEHKDVKFTTYMGDNRWFSVCLKSGKFLNFIRSFKHFLSNHVEIDMSEEEHDE